MASEHYWQKADQLAREAAKAFNAVADFLSSGPDLSDDDVRVDYWELQSAAIVAAEVFKEHYERSLTGGGSGGLDADD
ncbi:hypothetical protein [Pseudomonas sp. TCU-HL1]|uniref:hypothetical protein n=1 Tax=Pseudomonas sp. TCU-HL1 TaxID=1856685 RepID=UPI00083E5A51|nr:hypothetical protein [Pseudomonas sp. TCU-HL1]AOE86126.1 hypothetical protein THL1_3578 [Pseudomonas sp. TCU-HL1]